MRKTYRYEAIGEALEKYKVYDIKNDDEIM